jgi:23S rRNA (guanine745-N1)-methyltransferase
MMQAMLPEVLAELRCPVCRASMGAAASALHCPAGHAFDQATQGYVNLLVKPAASPGDSASMLDARAGFLGRGHFDPLARTLADLAGRHAGPPGLLVEVGAGTGYYLARVLDALPGRHGLAIDVSKHAARRAARAHARMAAVVADVHDSLPLADQSVALLLDVFAPRNGPELRRVLRPEGVLLVVTPQPQHLAELREVIHLIDVDPDKDRRLADTLDPCFGREPPQPLSWAMHLGRVDVGLLVAMGPSARHLDLDLRARQIAAFPEPTEVTAAVQVHLCRPRPG